MKTVFALTISLLLFAKHPLCAQDHSDKQTAPIRREFYSSQAVIASLTAATQLEQDFDIVLAQHVVSGQEIELLNCLRHLRSLQIGVFPDVAFIESNVWEKINQLTFLESLSVYANDANLLSISELSNLSNLKHLRLIGDFFVISKKDTEVLSQFTHLESLQLVGSFDFDDFKWLLPLKRLRSLQLSPTTKVEIWKDLALLSLPDLEHLDVRDTDKVNERQLAEFIAGCPNIDYLIITDLEPSLLRSIAKLKRLQYLSVTFSSNDQVDFGSTAEFQCLRGLTIEKAAFFDSDLASLAQHPSLERVDIQGSSLTDASIDVFLSMKQLRSVSIIGDANASRIQEAVRKRLPILATP
jgi:hypothetical protein